MINVIYEIFYAFHFYPTAAVYKGGIKFAINSENRYNM